MKKDISAASFRAILARQPDEEAVKICYCYEIGSTFVIYNSMEDVLIETMLMCNKVTVVTKLGDDAKNWERLLDKQQMLQGQTFGNLIKLLSKHGLDEGDLNYLQFLKEKRDFFVHRFFHRGDWPGDMDSDSCAFLIRRLLYLQALFMRASSRLPGIFGRAGLLQVQDLGDDGFLLSNYSLEYLLQSQ